MPRRAYISPCVPSLRERLPAGHGWFYVVAAGKPKREADVLAERMSGHSIRSRYATPGAVAARLKVGKTEIYTALANSVLT